MVEAVGGANSSLRVSNEVCGGRSCKSSPVSVSTFLKHSGGMLPNWIMRQLLYGKTTTLSFELAPSRRRGERRATAFLW